MIRRSVSFVGGFFSVDSNLIETFTVRYVDLDAMFGCPWFLVTFRYINTTFSAKLVNSR